MTRNCIPATFLTPIRLPMKARPFRPTRFRRSRAIFSCSVPTDFGKRLRRGDGNRAPTSHLPPTLDQRHGVPASQPGGGRSGHFQPFPFMGMPPTQKTQFGGMRGGLLEASEAQSCIGTVTEPTICIYDFHLGCGCKPPPSQVSTETRAMKYPRYLPGADMAPDKVVASNMNNKAPSCCLHDCDEKQLATNHHAHDRKNGISQS